MEKEYKQRYRSIFSLKNLYILVIMYFLFVCSKWAIVRHDSVPVQAVVTQKKIHTGGRGVNSSFEYDVTYQYKGNTYASSIRVSGEDPFNESVFVNDTLSIFICKHVPSWCLYKIK